MDVDAHTKTRVPNAANMVHETKRIVTIPIRKKDTAARRDQRVQMVRVCDGW